jgi:biotin operon repressor
MIDNKESILRHLAANRHCPLSASAIAQSLAISRTDAATKLAGLQTAGLAQLAVRGSGWLITARGVDLVPIAA